MKKLFFIPIVVFAMTACNSKGDTEQAAPVTDNGDAVIESIMTRSSVRSYNSDTVSDETVETLLRAAMAAPTAVNSQPWAFVVLKNPEKRAALAEALPNAGEKLTSSAVNILVCGDRNKFFEKEPDYWIQDCSAATENLLLAAHAKGLGAVWCGIYPVQERVESVSSILELPANIVPLCIIPIGYPDSEPNIKDKWKPENIITIE